MIHQHRSISRSTIGGASARFAVGVAARYGVTGFAMHSSSAMRMPPVSRIFQRLRRVVVTGVNGGVTFAPRLDVRITTFGRRSSEAQLSARHDVVAVGARLHQRLVSAASAEAIVQRSHARTVRNEVSDSGARSRRTRGAASVSVAEQYAPPRSTTQVSRVLRRRAPATADEVSPPTHQERGARMQTSQPRPQQLSPVEVARLTDHIVHTIDRRIAAFRERQGRV